MDLIIHTAGFASPATLAVEVVERKGLGHPDTICDALAESISVQLCRHYFERFGTILHHNVDKILLCGGSARAAFGGGEVLEPLELYLAGRATSEYQGEGISVAEIAIEACRTWLQSHLPALDLDRHVKIISRIRPGSGDLIRIYSKGHERTPLSNDTSCGAGFAPLTPLENVVLTVEHILNSAETKRAHPAIGHDIKVMRVRRGSRISLTIGCAMIGQYLTGIEDYLQAKIAARQVALEAARSKTTGRTDIPLTERGERDAQKLIARLDGMTFAGVLTSPLQRARRTGELAGFGERAEPDPDLMEWDYGAYEGRRTSDIRAERPGWRLFEDGCPGGETVEAVSVRADPVIGRIRALGGDALVFAHRDILRILAIRWLSLRAVEARHLYLTTASLSILGYDHDLDEPVIRLWNDGRHPIHSSPPEKMMPERI